MHFTQIGWYFDMSSVINDTIMYELKFDGITRDFKLLKKIFVPVSVLDSHVTKQRWFDERYNSSLEARIYSIHVDEDEIYGHIVINHIHYWFSFTNVVDYYTMKKKISVDKLGQIYKFTNPITVTVMPFITE